MIEMVGSSDAGASMVDVARAIVREGPYDAIEPTLLAPIEVRGLTTSAMRAFEDALAKGCVHALARHGGWRAIERRTASGVRVARLWEARTETLAFSPYTFELCRFLVTQPLGGGTRFEPFSLAPKTNGDELVAYLACALVEGKSVESIVASQPGVRASALAWLGFPRMLGSEGRGAPDAARFAPIVTSVLVDGLEMDLARRAARFARELGDVTSAPRLLALGRSRESVLGAFVDACIAHDRVESATFVVESAGAFASAPKPTLEKTATLQARLDARRATGGHLRVVGRLRREHEKARNVSYIDENYEGAQLLLARWEHVGNDGAAQEQNIFARAANALSQIESWDGG